MKIHDNPIPTTLGIVVFLTTTVLSSQTIASSKKVSALRCEIQNKVNAYRKSKGRSCLHTNKKLQRAAQSYAVWLSRNLTGKNVSNFGHHADGRTPTKRALDAGYKPRKDSVKKTVTRTRLADGTVITRTARKITSYKSVGENIVYFEGEESCKRNKIAPASFIGWKNSKSHRRNMLAKEWTVSGLGISWNYKTKRCFGVQLFGTANSPSRSCNFKCN